MPAARFRLLAPIILIALGCARPAPAAPPARYRVFTHAQAQQAVRIAREQCKPLVLHFVPDESSAAERIREYYGPKSPIPRADLERCIVLVLPRDRYAEFAESLGIQSAGGLRTVSPYELTTTDRWGLTTSREYREWQQVTGTAIVPQRLAVSRSFWKFPTEVKTKVEIVPVAWLKGKAGPLTLARYTLLDQPRPRFGCQVLALVPYGGIAVCRYRVDEPAEAAIAYLREAAEDFEFHARERFPAVFAEASPGDLPLLAGVAYAATRAVRGYASQLEEIFTTRRDGPLADMIQDACLDALIATSEDRAATARFFAYVGAQVDPPPGQQRCVEGLRRLEPEASAELFAYLDRCPAGAQRRRLALLIQRVTRVSSPERLDFWRTESDQQTTQAVVQAWREASSAALDH